MSESEHRFTAVDSHTEGMPTRVITGGVGTLPGETMLERKLRFEREQDQIRLSADARATRARGDVRRDPAAAVPSRSRLGRRVRRGQRLPADVRPRHDRRRDGAGRGAVGGGDRTGDRDHARRPGRAGRRACPGPRRAGHAGRRSATSRRTWSRARQEVDGIRYDLAYGGNFYAIAEASQIGLEVTPARAPDLIAAGLELMAEVPEPVHPEDPAIRGCHHVIWTGPPSPGADGRAATAIHPGWLDRSPCGTGTSARMATLHARGRWRSVSRSCTSRSSAPASPGACWRRTEVAGLPAVVPEISGRAWITGKAEYRLHPT